MRLWLNGELIDEATAVVPFNDHGITVGDGVFETLAVIRGTPFALRRHLERLAASALGLGLRLEAGGFDPALLREAATEVCALNGLDRGALRITVTSGRGPLGSARGAGPPTVIVAPMPPREWPPTTDVVVVPWTRNERGALAGLKTTSYAENVVAYAYASERGAGEAIFANVAGNLCEGTGSNVFLTVDGGLVTPPLSSGCLAGVTRALLLELGVAAEADVPVRALATADEAFLSSTTRNVQPIRAVDGRVVAAAPGELTAKAAAALDALIADDLDP